MKKLTVILIVLIIILFAAIAVRNAIAPSLVNPTPTNSPNSAENAPPGSIHNLPVPDAVKAARKALAEKLSISESNILILSALEKEWSDSCLGLGGPAESCLQAITPGYEVKMQAGGSEYVYRTNETGTAVREFTN
jgi:hypothetical protein